MAKAAVTKKTSRGHGKKATTHKKVSTKKNVIQFPVPTTGVLLANVAVLAQTVCDGPAFETVGKSSRVMVTFEIEGGQTPLLIVHLKTFAPTPIAVISVVGEVGEVINPAPEINVQLPVPTAGVLPVMV